MNTAEAGSRARHGGFWPKQTFNMAAVNDLVWVESCRMRNAASWDKADSRGDRPEWPQMLEAAFVTLHDGASQRLAPLTTTIAKLYRAVIDGWDVG